MFRPIFTLLWVVMLLSSTPAKAQQSSSHFDAGMDAFGQQNFHQALEHFRRAEIAGMSDARLDYNLGTVHYRLGQYNRSRQYFEKLVNNPKLGALAYYNLALIANKSGHDQAAIDLFKQCAELTTDPNLEALARKQIDTLTAPTVKSWFAYVAAYYGYDSNITLLPTSAGSDESGNFLQILALAEWEPYAKRTHSLNTSMLYFSRDFDAEGDLDNDSLTLGADYRSRFGDWRLEYGLELEHSSFGGDDFLSSRALSVKAKKTLNPGKEIRFRFRHEEISTRSSQFDFLDGSLTRFKTEYRRQTGSWEYRYELEQELNDRANTPQESFSPTRSTIGARVFYALSGKTTLGAIIDFRASDYQDVPAQNRKDERSRVRLEAEHRLNARWATRAELAYIDNKSSEDASDYRKYESVVSINAIF